MRAARQSSSLLSRLSGSFVRSINPWPCVGRTFQSAIGNPAGVVELSGINFQPASKLMRTRLVLAAGWAKQRELLPQKSTRQHSRNQNALRAETQRRGEMQ